MPFNLRRCACCFQIRAGPEATPSQSLQTELLTSLATHEVQHEAQSDASAFPLRLLNERNRVHLQIVDLLLFCVCLDTELSRPCCNLNERTLLSEDRHCRPT